MSTLATTRPPHTHTLSSSASAVTALSTPAVATPPRAPTQLLVQRRNVMHPDCLLLQTHGVTSPRLSPIVPAAMSEKARGAERRKSGMDAEIGDVEMSSLNERRLASNDADELSNHMDVGMEEEALEGQRTAIKLDATLQCNEADDDEAVSLCSEDSELSVGQEGSGGAAAETELEPDVDSVGDLQQQRRLLLHNVGDMMALCAAPSAFSSVANSGDGSDARSSASTDEASTLHGGDEDCNGAPTANAMMEPFVVASALRMPVSVPVPVPVLGRTPASPFQAEFMRKSHQYAEELMKQQMQFMAAARASAFTLRGSNSFENAADKRAFQPQAGLKMSEMPANLAGIHSHLTAITKMSQLSAVAAAAAAAAAVANKQQQQQQQQQHQQQTAGSSTLAKLSALGMLPQATAATQPNASAMPPVMHVSSLSQLQAHLPFMQCNNNSNSSTDASNIINNNNNNLHEPSLKFSIDNILKADFGRRITEPLKRAVTGGSGSGSNGMRATKCGSSTLRMRKLLNPTTAGSSSSAMDLTSLMCGGSTTVASAATVPNLSFSHTLAHICTNSSDSSGTAVSSSYGGAAAEHAKSPAAVSSSCNISPAHTTTATATTTTVGSAELTKSSTDEVAGSFSSQSGTSSSSSSSGSGGGGGSGGGTGASGSGPIVWPAWVYCTRYSDRPSSGPRARKPKKLAGEKGSGASVGAGVANSSGASATSEDKRPRTAFSGSQLARLKHEFTENRYLTEKRRQQLSSELGLNEAQIKIWFQNKRAKLKKSSGHKNPLALQLMAQGLYNHSTIPLTREEEELQELQERENAAAAGAANTTATSIST